LRGEKMTKEGETMETPRTERICENEKPTQQLHENLDETKKPKEAKGKLVSREANDIEMDPEKVDEGTQEHIERSYPMPIMVVNLDALRLSMRDKNTPGALQEANTD
jgi:chromatin segregation and condensation protein Rec8/ScpA/Scc1 (kleisin family)